MIGRPACIADWAVWYSFLSSVLLLTGSGWFLSMFILILQSHQWRWVMVYFSVFWRQHGKLLSFLLWLTKDL